MAGGSPAASAARSPPEPGAVDPTGLNDLTSRQAHPTTIARMTSADLPILIIDGDNFDDFPGFAREFSKLLVDHTWHHSLDAFNDILRGGFGTPEDGFVLRWLKAERSREVLGAEWFDQVVEIIRDHGPGGRQAGDRVFLELW